MRYEYKSKRARLVVESTGGKKLGNCYSASFYKVTSLYPLSDANMKALFETGAIGYGQEFQVMETYKEHELTPCVGITDSGEEVQNPNNPYSGKPYLPIEIPVYIYRIKTLCDSDD